MDGYFKNRASKLSEKSWLHVMRIMSNSYKLSLFSGVFHSTRMLIGALQALYLLETGISLNNLAFLKAYFALLVLIFDVPFGMLGDFISNKICIYFSCLFLALYYFLSLYSPDLTFLIIAESFYAMGLCLISGSLESLLVFSVRNEYQDDNSKISYFYFLSGEIMSIGSMIAAPLGVIIFILTGDMRSIYMLSFTFVLVLPCLIYKIDESSLHTKRIKKTFNKSYFKNILIDGNNLIYITVSSLVVIAYQPIYHFWQPLFIRFSGENFPALIMQDKNKNTAIILAFVFFIYSLSNYIANKIAKNKLSINNDSFRTTSLVSFLLLTSILIMIFVPETRLFLLIAVFSCAHGFMTVFSNLTKSVLIACTEKQQIATVISLSNVLGRLFSTIALFLCSLLINNDMLQYVFILTFISIMIATVIYLKDHPNRLLT